MNQETQVQVPASDFEVPAPDLAEFARTAVNAAEDAPRVAATGFSTCPAHTGRYC